MGGTYNLVQTVFTFSLLSKSADPVGSTNARVGAVSGIAHGSVKSRFQVSIRYLEDKPAGDIPRV